MKFKKNQQIALLCGALLFPIFAPAEVLDNIIAVVEDDVILENELQKEVSTIEQRIAASKAQMPP